MVYDELCHKEIDWGKAMKQILITLVAVVLGSSVVSSYGAGQQYKLCSDPQSCYSDTCAKYTCEGNHEATGTICKAQAYAHDSYEKCHWPSPAIIVTSDTDYKNCDNITGCSFVCKDDDYNENQVGTICHAINYAKEHKTTCRWCEETIDILP